jgi:hypothetical protein
MKRKWIIFPLGAFWLLAGCSAPVRIYSDVDDSGDFGNYSTYSFLDLTEGNLKTISGMELERIRVAFAREIEQAGFRFSEKEADVSVQITVYHRQNSDPYPYNPYGYNYMERAISVDMYDNHSKKHVWHCAAVGELVYDPKPGPNSCRRLPPTFSANTGTRNR